MVGKNIDTHFNPEKQDKRKRVNRKYIAWAMGAGLAMYGIHSVLQPWKEYAFLPIVGFMVIMGCLLWLFTDREAKLELGPKYVWIPMAVIIASMWARLAVDMTAETFAGALMGLFLFAVYVVSRRLGKDVFVAFIPFVVVEAVSCIWFGVADKGLQTGGIITNYCAAVGFMVFGTIVNKFKWQWVLATLVLVAIFFTGALEAVFIAGVLGIVILARRDWSRKILLPLGVLVIAVGGWTVLGYTQVLYRVNPNLDALSGIIRQGEFTDEALDKATTDRWEVINLAVNNIEPLGHGYKPGVAEEYTVHNVPLIITDQIGPLAGLAWLFIVVVCLVKTKWKYAWGAVLIMSVFDHYLWTQFAPFFWALAGISTASGLKSDLIFREVKDVQMVAN